MAGRVELREVETPRERKRFVQLPWKLHGADPFWVPPLVSRIERTLDPERDPFYDHAEIRLFLAWRDGEPVGRIASIVNYLHNNVHADKMGFWGFFETVRSNDVARALLDTAAEELRTHGLDEMSGPFDPSINAECGLLIDGFNLPPAVRMPYNPSYYPQLVETAGHAKLKDLHAYLIVDEQLQPGRRTRQRLDRIAQGIHQRHPDLSVRHLDMTAYESDMATVIDLLNTGRRENWGAVPTTDDEARQMAEDLKQIVIPDLVLIAERGGRPVGCILSVPDISPILKKCNGRLFPLGWLHLRGLSRIRRVRIFGAAVHPEHDEIGVLPLLFQHYVGNALRLGMEAGEVSWLCEDDEENIRALETAFQPRLTKRYRIYQRAL